MPLPLPVRALRPCIVPAVSLLLGAATLRAAPPVVTGITPRGAERGQAVELTVSGTNLAPAARLVLPFAAHQERLPDARPNPAQARFRLTVDAAVPVGTYPGRLLTDDGVSAPLLFDVDALPGMKEVEDNNTFDKAQKVTPPVVVTGDCPGGDVDYYRFPGRKGRRYVVETETARLGSAVVPQIRVTDAGGRFLGADDSQAVQGDCRVAFTAPADGDYVVEFSDSRYRGGTPAHYRLRIGEYDWADEVFPLGGRRGDTVAFTLRGGGRAHEVRLRRRVEDGPEAGLMRLDVTGLLGRGAPPPVVAVGDLPERVWDRRGGKEPRALDILPPVTINGRLEQPGAGDHFQIAVRAGQRFRIALQAAALGSRLDGVLSVTDQAGRQVALVDDVDLPPPAAGLPAVKSADPAAVVAVPAGANLLVVEVRDQRGRGGVNFGYRLSVEPAVADFAVVQPASEVNLSRGGSAALVVPVIRRGYAGPVELSVTGLPPGVSARGGHVPARANAGVLTLTASASWSGLTFPSIEGRAVIEGREVRRRAAQQLVLSQDGGVPLSVLPLDRVALAPVAAEAFTVQGPPAVEVVRGYPLAVPLKVGRTKEGQSLAVAVTGTAPASSPPGQPPTPYLTFLPATAAAGVGSAACTITATAQAPARQPFEFVPEGKARVGAAERAVSGPAVTVKVAEPFAVELASPTVTLRPGGEAVLSGTLRRQTVFKEPVQIKLEGLPAGVSLAAPPAAVPAGKAEIRIPLRAAPETPAATATATLTCSTVIAGTAYAEPPIPVTVRVAPVK